MATPANEEQTQRDGCSCPDYISYCVHVDGDVFWILSREDGGREFTRRTGLDDTPGIHCPRCGNRVTTGKGRAPFYVYGPGTPSSPQCLCFVELNLRNPSTGVRKADTLEEAFELTR
jgi:DNA-directed RNA polymerase subunit RPC12/RpoP